ncbi:MAG: peptidylprolyl isomerase [Bacteroidales bacterium]
MILITAVYQLPAQEKVIIDQVVAVVGNSSILKSDLYNQQRQLESQGVSFGSNAQCELLDEMLYQKLLFNQAVIDSIEVSDMQVEQILERRLRFFIQQIGSREQLEAYYGKTIDELKDEFRPLIREQELSQMMESQITENVRVTPSEVRSFFNNLPPDSIPTVESETELAQIVIKPQVEPDEIAETKRRLNELRERILQGESFNTLAILYSEDPGSARRGGELGFYGRGELYPEFEATAFGLRPGEVSEVIETQAGFHIMQMIERRGEQINVRHILMQPQISPLQLSKARSKLDSIRNLIINEEMTFAEAAMKFSDDPGKINGGAMINPYTNTTRFRNEEIDQNLFFVVDRLEEGEISSPVPMMAEDGKQAFRIVKVIRRIDAHLASLEGDYDFIQQIALNKKKMDAVQAWIKRKIGNTFISINENYLDCNFSVDWTDRVARASN